jgi:ATP:ADP antiporter, AAA family
MTSTSALPSDAPKSGLVDRMLRPFSEVHAGEGPRALGLLLSLFILMVAYYVLKTVREPLILAGGAEIKSYAAGLQALVLIAFVPAYGWLTRRVGRRGLILGLVGFFVVNLEIFYVALKAGWRFVGVAFFVWVGIFSLSVIAQFWSLANDLYEQDEGERLFPIIAFGATIGSPIGARIAGALFGNGVSPATLLQIAAGLLVIHGLLTLALARPVATRAAAAKPEPSLAEGESGFVLIFRSPYLRLVALLLVLLNIVNTVGEYVLGKNAVAAAKEAVAHGQAASQSAFLGHFYGEFFFWVNVTAAVMQALLVSRLVKRFGIRGVLYFLPMLAFGIYGLMAAGAGFVLVRWLKTAENATDYSVMNTAKAMLWLPATRQEKYRAKQAVDTFFVRLGDVISTGLVAGSVFVLHVGPGVLAAVNAVLCALWLTVAWRLAAHHDALLPAHQKPAPCRRSPSGLGTLAKVAGLLVLMTASH